METKQSDLESVTEDKTPAVVHAVHVTNTPTDTCGKCGAVVQLLSSCWIVDGRVYCATDACKPVRKVAISALYGKFAQYPKR